MNNDTLSENSSIVPVLLSLFVGFVVVLIISGLVINFTSRYRDGADNAEDESQDVVIMETENGEEDGQDAGEDEDKLGFFERLRNALSFGGDKGEDEQKRTTSTDSTTDSARSPPWEAP